jgi:DNA-binding FrmR family transcriptional regulator
MKHPHPHQTHKDVVNRLKRATGHLNKIIEMIENETPCLEVAQQLQAVTSALSNAKRVYVQDHIEHCLDEKALASDQRRAIAEFKEIAKYL